MNRKIPKESSPASKPPPRFLKTGDAATLRDVCITLCDVVIELTNPMDTARVLAARAALLGTQPDREPEFEGDDGRPF